MRALRLACAMASVGVSTALACSLIDRSSDYFDPTGEVVTLANEPNAHDVVLTTTGVLFVANDVIYRVPKVGGVVRPIHTGTAITAIQSDGVGRVVWVESSGPNMGVHHWDDAADAEQLDFAGTAELAAATSTRVLYTLPIVESDAGFSQAVVMLEGDASTSATFVAAGTQPPPIVVASAGGRLYFKLPNDLARLAVSGDDDAATQSNSGLDVCYIAGFGTHFSYDELIVDRPDGGAFESVVAGGGRFAATSGETCCTHKDGAPNSCDEFDPAASTSKLHTVALSGGSVYRLNGSRLEKAPFADLIGAATFPDATTVGPPLGGGHDPSYLAVDDAWAFFIAGDQIQRLKLTP